MKVFEIVEFQAKTTQDDVAKMQQIGANIKQANLQGNADAAMQAGAELGNMLSNKVYPDLLKVLDKMVRELEVACKKYANDPKWAEQCKQLPQLKADLEANKRSAMQSGVANIGRQDVGENSSSKGAALLSKIDSVLDGSGLKRQGFELVKDPNSFTRGSITDEALTMIKNMLAKAQAMGATDSPDPKPIMNPADVDDKEFEGMYETTTASAIAVAPVGVSGMQSRSMRNKDGTIKNALDVDVNIMGGHKPKKNKKKA